MKKILIVFLLLFLSACSKTTEVVEVEQEFRNIELNLYSGELTVEEGEEVSLTRQNGSTVEYTISDDTLYINKISRGDLILTIPEDYTFDTITINSYGGDLTYKPLPVTATLNLNILNGNIVLSKAKSEQTNIYLDEGYIFISGNLGENVKVDCKDGYIKLKPSTTKETYNYSLDLTEDAYLNLGGYKYDNVDVTEQVFNRVQNRMTINMESGNVIVKFKS